MAVLPRVKKWIPGMLSFVLGGVLFLLIYGPSTLNPQYESWIFNGYIGVDILQHYAGWAAFRAGGWAFPLTFTPLLSWPYGGAASLADCIPLVAVAAKVCNPVLPETFQYFGWFVLASMALGGWAGNRLLAIFGFSPAARVMGSLFFAASPVLLERAFQHTALTAHYLVVWGLVLYFSSLKKGKNPVWGFIPLAALAVSIHVYFVPMVLALAFAAQLEYTVARRKAVDMVWLGLPVMASVAAAWIFGFFSASEYQPGGYGSLGLNLNAFWNPASFNWGIWDPSYQNLIWSRFLPQRPVVGDSLEAFSYLGLGILAGLGFAGIWAAARLVVDYRAGGRPAKWVKHLAARGIRHVGLVTACAALGLFAVTNVVTANSRVLFRIPLPGIIIRFCDMFRASGRLIWPVYYLLVLAALYGSCQLALFVVYTIKNRVKGGNKTHTGLPMADKQAGKDGPPAASNILPEESNPPEQQGWQAEMQYDAPDATCARQTDADEAAINPRRNGLQLGKVVVPLAMAVILLIQWMDLAPILRFKRDFFAAPIIPQSYAPPENWERIVQPGRVLYLLELQEDRPTALRAALAGMPTNFYLLARGTPSRLAAHMQATRQALLAGSPPDSALVYLTKDMELAAQLEVQLADSCEIFPMGGYMVFLPKV